MSAPIAITLAHSADADDVYMWWPITGKLKPRGDGNLATDADLIEPPPLTIPGLRFVARPGDIGIFNRHAVEDTSPQTGSRPDAVVAISYPALLATRGRYLATTFGSSFGDRFGPSLVARPGTTLDTLRGSAIAVPGLTTTACITLRLCFPRLFTHPAPCTLIERPFDQVSAAVHSGQAAAGLIIHEEKLTFARAGLIELADLGRAWFDRTGLPLPLGANAVRADLDLQHGPGTRQRVVDALWCSLQHAAANHQESAAYAATWAAHKLADAALARRYLAMYVNRLTLDPRDEAHGSEGPRAIRVFAHHAHQAGLIAADATDLALLAPTCVH